MAVEQKVVIRVEIDPDLGKAAAVNAALLGFDKNAKRANRSLSKVTNRLDKDFQRALGRVASKLGDFGAKLIKINLKAFGVELFAVVAGLVAMKAALAAGQMVMRAWHSTISFMKVGVAGLTAGIIGLVSTIAAANRQFAQVQLAPFVGGLQAARTAMSGMRMGSTAQMGIQNLTLLANTLSRGGVDSRNVGMLTRAFGNFTGGDVKATQGMAQAWTQMTQTGNKSVMVDQMKSMGPAYKEATKAFQAYEGDDLVGAMIRGEFTPDAMKGSLDKLDDTVMGGFKGMITTLYNQLADIGSVFLVPLRDAMNDVERILRGGLLRVTGILQSYGLGTFMPALVRGMERATDFFVKLILEDLPRFTEVMGKIANWWRDFKSGTSRFFGDLGDSMRQFSDSGDHAWQFLKNMFGSGGIGGFISDRMKAWNDMIVQNAAEFELFGERIGGAIKGLLEVITATKDEFFNILPQLNDFLLFLTNEVFPVMQDFVTQFVKAFKQALPVIRNVVSAFLPLLRVMNSLIGVLATMPGGLGGLAVLGMGWLGMTRGGRASMGYMRAGATGGARPSGAFAGIGYGVGQAGSNFSTYRQVLRAEGAGKVAATTGAAKAAFGQQGLTGGGMMIAGMVLGQSGNAILAGLGQSLMMGGMGYMMGGTKMGMAAMGMSGLMGAYNAQTATGGAVSGAMGGGLMAGSLGLLAVGAGVMTGGAAFAVAGLAALGAGALGWWKGGKNEDEKNALTETGMRVFGEDAMAEFAEGGRASMTADLKDFNEIFLDDDKFKAWARTQGFDEDEALKHRAGIAGGVADSFRENLASLDRAVGTIAERTGMHAEDIEIAADRMGIALRDTKSSLQDFYMGLYEQYETKDMASGIRMYADQINKSFADVVFGSRFHKGARVDEALGQSKAANNVMLQELLTTGTISNDSAAAGIDAAIAQGQALGFSGYELVQFVERFGEGWQADMEKRGLGKGAKKFTNEIAAFSERTFNDFVDSESVKQLQIMNEVWDRPQLTRAGLREMWTEGDIEQELAKANMEVWKLAREAKKAETDAVVAATTAMYTLERAALAAAAAESAELRAEAETDDPILIDIRNNGGQVIDGGVVGPGGLTPSERAAADGAKSLSDWLASAQSSGYTPSQIAGGP